MSDRGTVGRARVVSMLGLFALVAAGCSSSATVAPATPPPRLGPPNAEVEAAGEPTTMARFVARAAEGAGVCLGEQHDVAAHHRLHAQLLDAWAESAAARGRQVALALEMFEIPLQPALDAFARGEWDFRQLVDASDWRHRWGYDPEPYRAMFEVARRRGIALVAANAPRALTRAVARRGLDGLTPELRAEVPELVLDDPEHREFFAAAMGAAAHSGGFGALYTAQVIWDETMAASSASWLTAAPRRFVVLVAGNGHCHESAVPRRLLRRLGSPGGTPPGFLAVLTRTRGGELPLHAASDYVLTVDEERMAKQKKDEAPPIERYGDGVIARNRRAAFDYELGDTYEAGVQLTGSEVKVLRAGKADLSEAYVTIDHEEAFVHGANIPEQQGAAYGHEAKRKRKLLLHRQEIEAIARATEREGMTVVATKIYFRGGRAKLEIALARGKKQFDKRETLKRKEADREARAAIAGRRG